MTDIASPPATGEWFDVAETAAAVLHKLRLQGGDVDAVLIDELVYVVGVEIDQYVDRVEVLPGPPPEPDIQHALVEGVILLYRSNHPVGQSQSFFPPPYPSLLAVFDATIGHRKERWAVA